MTTNLQQFVFSFLIYLHPTFFFQSLNFLTYNSLTTYNQHTVFSRSTYLQPTICFQYLKLASCFQFTCSPSYSQILFQSLYLLTTNIPLVNQYYVPDFLTTNIFFSQLNYNQHSLFVQYRSTNNQHSLLILSARLVSAYVQQTFCKLTNVIFHFQSCNEHPVFSSYLPPTFHFYILTTSILFLSLYLLVTNSDLSTSILFQCHYVFVLHLHSFFRFCLHTTSILFSVYFTCN